MAYLKPGVYVRKEPLIAGEIRIKVYNGLRVFSDDTKYGVYILNNNNHKKQGDNFFAGNGDYIFKIKKARNMWNYYVTRGWAVIDIYQMEKKEAMRKQLTGLVINFVGKKFWIVRGEAINADF